MTPLLCTLALIALSQDLKPLPEERNLVETEQVALDYSRLQVAELGMLGWTKTTVQRGQMEGATHYLVHRVAELADFKALGFQVMESRGLYDSDLRLVHEFRRTAPMGADSKSLELEWGDEGFRWREGRDRWNAGGSEVRPTVDTDVALFVHGLSISTPWEAQVFDDTAKVVEKQTVQPGKAKTIDDQKVTIFKVDGSNPLRHLVRDDGVYLRSELETLKANSVEIKEGTELALRQELADNEAFEKVLDQKLAAAWTEKKGTFTNPVFGMSFKLPKGWKRVTGVGAEGSLFSAYSADQNAYVNVVVSLLGTGYTLDGWSEGLLEAYAGIAEEGEVKIKQKSIAKLSAVSFDYVLASDAPLDVTAYAWERDGLGIVLSGGTWQESPKKLHKETASILKSIKFAR